MLRRESTDTEDRLLCYGCCLSLFTVLLHSVVDFPLQVLAIQVWVVVLLALCWCRNNEGKRL
jgi:hypothetical protein